MCGRYALYLDRHVCPASNNPPPIFGPLGAAQYLPEERLNQWTNEAMLTGMQLVADDHMTLVSHKYVELNQCTSWI
jgi:hypothetical protein